MMDRITGATLDNLAERINRRRVELGKNGLVFISRYQPGGSARTYKIMLRENGSYAQHELGSLRSYMTARECYNSLTMMQAVYYGDDEV